MKDTSNTDSAIFVGIASTSGCYQFAALFIARLAKLWVIIMRVSQNIAHLLGHLLQQEGRDFVVCRVGYRQLCRQGNPQATDTDRQMQFPAVPPTVPSRLRPTRFTVYRSVRNLPF